MKAPSRKWTAVSDEAFYLDGETSKKRRVTLRFGPGLEISESGAFLTAWPYADVRLLSDDRGVWRLRAMTAAELARLEIGDAELEARIAAHCPALRTETAQDVSTTRIVAWSLAAAASIVALIWFGLPLLADRLASLVPLSLERRLGAAAENQIRAVFNGRPCVAPRGVAALEKLSQRLQAAANLRLEARIVVLSSKVPNAFALPGGEVYLLSGLLAKTESADGVTGVLAHELGHLQHRDHLRRMIADGGAGYLIGLLFGDVTGGGALILAGKSLLFAAHSREAEAEADAFAAQTLAKLGRPTKPMGELLLRITGKEDGGMLTILHDHPLSQARLDDLAREDKGATQPPLLTDEEWAALKAICGEGERAR
jgi:predicted Zn-dependent protease